MKKAIVWAIVSDNGRIIELGKDRHQLDGYQYMRTTDRIVRLGEVGSDSASIDTHTLADQLGNAVAKHLGQPVTSGLRLLLLGVVQGHTGKLIEGVAP